MTPINADSLAAIHQEASRLYDSGGRSPHGILSPESAAWIFRQGLSLQFVFDCVDDLARYGEPSVEDFIAMALQRAAFHAKTPPGAVAPAILNEPGLPPKAEAFDGIPWLPRIVRKARAFLEGNLCDEIMYGCAGDRAFLKKHGLSLSGFLALCQRESFELASIRKALCG